MINARLIGILSLISCLAPPTYSQNLHLINGSSPTTKEHKNNNCTYLEQIKTVQLYPLGQENGFPIIHLNKEEKLVLTFDDLRAGVRDYFMRIQHCNADWTPSGLSPFDYVSEYNEYHIVSTEQALGTLQPYTHYQAIFPNEYLQPKIGGNYLLNIYEGEAQHKPVLSRRFYVVNNNGITEAKFVPSRKIERENTYQKLNVDFTTTLAIPNVSRDLQVHVFQNKRPDNMQIGRQPTFIEGSTFKYQEVNTFNFIANNTFRSIDIRSINGSTATVERLEKDSIFTLYLFPDNNEFPPYQTSIKSNNSSYYTLNLENDRSNIPADYVNVIFSLKTSSKIEGNIYLVGEFNDFTKSIKNKLVYHPIQNIWQTTQQLKQDVYDYTYIVEDEKSAIIGGPLLRDSDSIDNNYQILVYLRKNGTFWDEIIDYTTICTHN